MAYLLDTNILSELMRPNPNPHVLAWLDRHYPLYISTITQAELLFGAYRMADGKKKQNYLTAIHTMLQVDFAGRLLAFDVASAYHYAQLTADRLAKGRPIHTADGQIASIAKANHLILVTRNVKDFVCIDGLTLINPFEV